VDHPQPPPPLAARLRVDVALERVGLLDAPLDVDHLVALVARREGVVGALELADHLVGHGVLHHEAQSAAPRALEPAVVLGLVGGGVGGAGPVGG